MAFMPETKILRVTPGKLSKYVEGIESVGMVYTPGKSIISVVSTKEMVPAELTLHVKSIKLSKVCRKYIAENLEGDKFIKLKWIFLDSEEFIQSPEALTNQKLKLDFTAQYQLDLNHSMIESLDENPVIFHVFVDNKSDEISLSKANFFIEDLLSAVNRKQEARVRFVNSSIDAVASCIAYLDIWYKFSCNKKNIKKLFFRTKEEAVKKRSSIPMFDVMSADIDHKRNFDNFHVTDSELDQFADNFLLVLNRNKVLKTTQSEINHTLEERVRWLRYEANWKQTLQENAILHGKDPEAVIWRQWREEDTANVRLRTYDNIKPETYRPQLSITIVKLHFLENSYPMLSDAVHQIYVEYSFLGQEGPEMETPFSILKSSIHRNMVYNFTKTFDIDIENNYENCKMLTELIKNDDVIRFMVISEPLESLERPIQTCQEVGYAEVRFEEIIQQEDNIDIYQYEVLDINHPMNVVGYITVRFEGILAMRKMALTLMAPKGYKAFM
jgi:hypothetical protein